MATPFVPVPVPMDRALPGSANSRRPKRASSLGSISSSSESSSTKGTVEDVGSENSNSGNSSYLTACQSPVTRARMNGFESTVEYSNCSRPETPPHTPAWEERPITPTVLGYEVMEERAKFTVNGKFLIIYQTENELSECVLLFIDVLFQ